jgi:hypothetical protein
MSRRSLLVTGIALSLILVTVLGAWAYHAYCPGGIQATVTNTGDTDARDVCILVTNGSYPLGDLAPGQSKTVCFHPSGKSHLELELTTEQGRRVRLNAGGYFTSGATGTIKVSVKNGTIEHVEHDVKTSYY